MTLAGLRRLLPPQLNRLLDRPGVAQLIRYVIAGFCVSEFAAAVYSAQVFFLHAPALQANVVSTACGLAAGYLVHSRWSFAGGAANGQAATLGRFLLSSGIAFVVNSGWVWLLVTILHLPPLAPVPLMMFVTPWVSFLLNRYWVFKAA